MWIWGVLPISKRKIEKGGGIQNKESRQYLSPIKVAKGTIFKFYCHLSFLLNNLNSE